MSMLLNKGKRIYVQGLIFKLPLLGFSTSISSPICLKK